ncbi:MAG: glycosyltransferase [Ruminococcus sp.]|nr:glycosyltransferase [Ruminococcus sp.]
MPKQEKRKLHVLQVNKAYYPHIGGIETLVRSFSKSLQQRGAEVRVLVCQESRSKGADCVVDGVPVHYASSLGTYFSCPLSISFLRKFRQMAKWADVIEMHMPFPLGDLACLLSGYHGAVVIAWHSDVVRQKKLMRFYRPLLMRFLRRADAVIVATQGHIDSSPILSQFREKCRVIPYGIDVDAYRSVPREPILRQHQRDPKSVRVLFVGRFVYYKGIEVLLDAFGRVHGCELFLVGRGTAEMQAKLAQMAQEEQITDRVHFLGNLEEQQLRAAFADCEIFVLPSVANSEAFGIVQLEAMVYGKPVINTALSTGVPYVSVDGETGLAVPPENPEALAKAIQKLADDPVLRAAYGAAAAKRVEQMYQETDVIDAVEQVLKEFAERRRIS